MMSGWWIQTMQWKCRNEWQEWNKRRDKIRSCVKVAFGSYVAPSPLVGQEFSFCFLPFRSCALIAFISYDHYHSFVNCTKWSKFSGVRHQACCRVAWLAVDIITIVGCYYYHQPSSRAAATRRRRPEQPEHAIRDIQTKWIPRTMISVFRSVWTKLELFWKCKIWNISYHPLVIQQTLGWTDLLTGRVFRFQSGSMVPIFSLCL